MTNQAAEVRLIIFYLKKKANWKKQHGEKVP